MSAATDLYVVSRWLLSTCVQTEDDQAAHDLYRAARAVEEGRLRILDLEDLGVAEDRWADDGGMVG